MVVDCIMRQPTAGKRTGVQWTFTKQLENLGFANDIILLSHRQQDAQEKQCRVAEEAERNCLQINIGNMNIVQQSEQQTARPSTTTPIWASPMVSIF